MLSILLILLLNNVYSQIVVICTGEYAKVYHSRDDCTGLNNCKGDLIRVYQSEAINKYKLQRPCCVCWYPSSIGCGTDDIPNNNQPTKFNPYVPQFRNEEEMKLYAYANAKKRQEEAAAYAAAGALAVGAIIGSNDFYIQYFKEKRVYMTAWYGMVVDDRGLAFGFRKTFNKSFIEYGASVIPKSDYQGLDGGYPKWAGHFNYIRNLKLVKGKDKLNLFIGPSINSFFTESASFGIGGITGFSYKLSDWLKFDTRYELTSTTDRLGASIVLTFNQN